MSLAVLVREDNWQEFDKAWHAAMDEGGPIEEVLAALGLVSEKRRMPRCLPMVREHAGRLSQAERFADAAQLLGAALIGGGPPGELSDQLHENAAKAWGSAPHWPRYCEMCGFAPGVPDPRRAWKSLREMMAYSQGAVVFHAAGWGVGEVVEVDPDAVEVTIQFQGGKRDRFPLKTAVEIFDLLANDDLRVQGLRDRDALKARLKSEPLEILRAVLHRYNGKAATTVIKNTLAQVGVTGSAWTNWWKQARLLAENDPWFRLSGRGPKITISLLEQATDPAQGIRRELLHAQTLGQALARVRELISGGADPAIASAAVALLRELASQDGQPLPQRVATWIFLREHTGQSPEELTALLSQLALASPSRSTDSPPLWDLFAQLGTVREQERCVELLAEVFGETWLEEAGRHLPHAAPGMVKPIIDALLASGQAELLGDHYRMLLARPTRAPFALMALTRLGESGALPGSFPTPPQRAQALVELAVHLNELKKGNTVLTRAHQKLIDLLVKGNPPLLETLLADARPATMRVLANMLHRGVDDVLDAALTDRILEVAPEVIRGGERAFWDEDRIWTTAAGLRKRESELRELHTVRIPANREAIARAASYGDLSENAEWEQAIEEQRQLTEAAATIERELRLAGLLEQVSIPEDTVAPGTAVIYRELEAGVERRIVLLGPWDGDVPDAVSYRAPLAQGMLGLHTGGETEIQLPQGTIHVRVLDIQLAEVGAERG